MRVNPFMCMAAVALMVPAAASADDPHDRAMRSAAARARDSDMTRQLNREAGATFRERDARNLQDWRTSGDGYDVAAGDYAARSQDHERAMSDYARDRARYEQDIAAWHRAVAACRAGDYAACD